MVLTQATGVPRLAPRNDRTTRATHRSWNSCKRYFTWFLFSIVIIDFLFMFLPIRFNYTSSSSISALWSQSEATLSNNLYFNYLHNIFTILVCQLPIRGVTADAVKEAVVLGKSSNGPMTVMMHELKVAYELLLDAKRHKQRIADVVLAAQDCSRTPPAAGTSPRILGSNTILIS